MRGLGRKLPKRAGEFGYHLKHINQRTNSPQRKTSFIGWRANCCMSPLSRESGTRETSMFGRLRWLLVGAIVISPVTVDLRRGFTWSEASAQYLNCAPIVLNYYSFNQFIGSVVRFRSPPPTCVTPTCVRWGACISEARLDFGLFQQNKLNPQGCLLRVCTSRPAVSWFAR